MGYDPYRFQLIEEQISGGSQANSQTSQMTAYEIHHSEGFRIPYSLTIVDTPGYGDTKGLERDKEITEMIRKFFEDENGIQELDVVGFVSQASLPRLTPTQIYIFDSILSIFGKDVKENINFLLTHADGQLPPVLSGIKKAEFPYPTDHETGEPLHHRFNNSGFFSSNSSADKFNRFFWIMGTRNFEKFFNVLATMKTKSLSLTKQVLEQRKRLEMTIDGLQPLIKFGLAKKEELRKQNQFFLNHRAQIDAKKDVPYEEEVSVPKKVTIPDGQYLTNCNKCYITCHNPCAYKNDEDKVKCWAMDHSKSSYNRPCRICPKKCTWDAHVNQPYKFEYVKEKRITSSESMRKECEIEMKKKVTTEKMIKLLEKKIKDNDQEVLARVETVTQCLQRLEEIALRPNPFSTPEYIDIIIEAELQNRQTGFQERIESLKELRKKAVIMFKIRNEESLLNINPNYDVDK